MCISFLVYFSFPFSIFFIYFDSILPKDEDYGFSTTHRGSLSHSWIWMLIYVHWSTLVHILSSLVFFLCFFLLWEFSLLSHFPFSNAGCGSGYYQIPMSADLQTCVFLLNHLSSLAMPTLSHFSRYVVFPLWETCCGRPTHYCPRNSYVVCLAFT